MKQPAIATYTGFFTPHHPVDYDGTITNSITGEVTTPPSMTKQSHVAECDINNIVRDFMRTGQMTHLNTMAQQGMYADLTNAPDFQEALHQVQRAEQAFATLPAKLRNELGNDPSRFLDYLADPANLEKLYDWGIAIRPETPPPAAPAPSTPPAPPSA